MTPFLVTLNSSIEDNHDDLYRITGHAADWEDGADQATRAIRGLSTFERPVYAVLFTHREPA